MILSIDGGLATFGWSIVRPCTGVVVALGEINQPADTRHGINADRERRADVQANELRSIVNDYGVTVIVAEALSLPSKGRTNAVASIMLSAGVVRGVAACHGLAIVTVAAKVWQRGVYGDDGKPVDYTLVEQMLAAYLVGEPREQLLAIPRGRRNHPLDSVGVGVYASQRLVPEMQQRAARSA